MGWKQLSIWLKIELKLLQKNIILFIALDVFVKQQQQNSALTYFSFCYKDLPN